jgi:hypothetical protein
MTGYLQGTKDFTLASFCSHRVRAAADPGFGLLPKLRIRDLRGSSASRNPV